MRNVTPTSEQSHCQASAEAGVDGGSLVSPHSGLANDYLNVFNEILLLLEYLPTMPDMVDEALAWRALGYREYFEKSQIAGSKQALRAYDKVDPRLREAFENLIFNMSKTAASTLKVIADHVQSDNFPQAVIEPCSKTAELLRADLDRAADLVNNGRLPRLKTA